MALCLANLFKKCDRYQAARGRNERVAGLVPFGVVFSAEDVEKVAFVKS